MPASTRDAEGSDSANAGCLHRPGRVLENTVPRWGRHGRAGQRKNHSVWRASRALYADLPVGLQALLSIAGRVTYQISMAIRKIAIPLVLSFNAQYGSSALHLAAKSGHADCVMLLAQMGADVRLVDRVRLAVALCTLQAHLRSDPDTRGMVGVTRHTESSHSSP